MLTNEDLNESGASSLDVTMPYSSTLSASILRQKNCTDEWAQDKTQSGSLDYWREQLIGIEPLRLASDCSFSSTSNEQRQNYPLALPESLTQDLFALARSQDATLYMTLLAAFNVLLHSYSGQHDLCVGKPITNFNQAECEGKAEFSVNTLVLRTNVDGNPSFEELLQRIKEVTLDAYTHQDLPFEKLTKALGLSRSQSHALCRVRFALLDDPMDSVVLPGLQLQSLIRDTDTAQFDLSLELTETHSGLQGRLEYNSELLTEDTIAQMVRDFETLLQSVIVQPNQPIKQFVLLR